MKKVITLIILSIFIFGFISAAGITASAIEDDNETEETGSDSNQNQINNSTQNQAENSENAQEMENIQNQAENRLNAMEIGEIVREKNRIRTVAGGECSSDCSCEDSTTKCQFTNGTREMTIRAGESGNMIIQTKGVDASTQVELYKSEDKIYGKFSDTTKEVKVFPDEVQEKIRERIQARLENQTIELDDDGIYQVQLQKRARLLGLFSVKARVNAEVDSETGEVLRIRNPWWDFIATDETEEESE